MYIDKAKIFIKAGDGGNGCTSFYTEKYVSNGGPDGGDGGKGGDVIFSVGKSKSSLADFKYAQHFRAENGEKGSPRYCNGKGGKDLVIEVPRGTVIKDAETGGIIADMFDEDSTVKVLTGGGGGKGNSRFKSSRRQAPHFSQTGEKTEEKCVILELKTLADVGLIGYPNVGKSTLLSVISSARPKIADYHFTTLTPNLGVVSYYDKNFVVADIPGLIDGAGTGAGLGHEFLRHVERTRLLIHVVDISGIEGRDPVQDYKNINRELKIYNPELAATPQIIALNKADLLPDDAAIKRFKAAVRGKKIVVISGAAHRGLEELIKVTAEKLDSLPPLAPMEFEPFVYEKKRTDDFEIVRDDSAVFEVIGGMIEEIARGVVLNDYDSFNYFQKTLKERGVIKALKKAGAETGDTVRILDFEFEFVE